MYLFITAAKKFKQILNESKVLTQGFPLFSSFKYSTCNHTRHSHASAKYTFKWVLYCLCFKQLMFQGLLFSLLAHLPLFHMKNRRKKRPFRQKQAFSAHKHIVHIHWLCSFLCPHSNGIEFKTCSWGSHVSQVVLSISLMYWQVLILASRTVVAFSISCCVFTFLWTVSYTK